MKHLCVTAMLGLLTFGIACQRVDPFPRQCTLIGCANSLVVELDRVPTAPFRLQLTQSGTGTKKEYDCAAGTCQQVILFTDFVPPTVDVTITTSTATKTQTVTPTYTKSRPNGPGCEPECTSGKMQVTVP